MAYKEFRGVLGVKLCSFVLWCCFVFAPLYGGIVEDGIEAKRNGDTQKAMELFKQACDKNNGFGCYDLAVVLKDESEKQRYFLQAKRVFEQGCEQDRLKECNALGIMYGGSVGVKKDVEKSIVFFTKGCDGGFGVSCVNAGGMYEELYDYSDKGYKIANAYYKKACDMQIAQGCYNLGMHYLEGKGVQKDTKKAYRFLSFSCDLGYKYGCKEIKKMSQDRQQNGSLKR